MIDPDPQGRGGETESQLVAIFEHRLVAEGARYALLSAGVPAHAIELVDHPQPNLQPGDPDPPEPAETASPAPEPGFWAALGRLFAPHDEAHELSRAIDRGHVMVVVHPADPAEREVAIEALEGCGPLDLDERRPHPATYDQQAVRIVEERSRVGWRDRPDASGRVRQYLAAKPQEDRHRVELQEDDLAPPSDPAARS